MGTTTFTSSYYKSGYDAKGLIPPGTPGHDKQTWSTVIEQKKSDAAREQSYNSAMNAAAGGASASSSVGGTAFELAKQASDLAFDSNSRQMNLSNIYRTKEGATQGQMDAAAAARSRYSDDSATGRTQIQEAGATGRTQFSEDSATKRTGMSIASQEKMPEIQSTATGLTRDADADRAQKALASYRKVFGR